MSGTEFFVWKLKFAGSVFSFSKLFFYYFNPFYIAVCSFGDIVLQCFKVELLFINGDFIGNEVIPEEAQRYLKCAVGIVVGL